MRKIFSNKKLAAVAVAAVAVTGTGVAYAYWTTTGSGSGTGSTTAGVEDMLTFTQNPADEEDVSVDLEPMFPGDAEQDLTVRVRNTSDESAYVQFVKAYITTNADGCDGSNFLIDGDPAPSTEETAVDLTWTAQDLAADAADDATGTVQFNNKTDIVDDPDTEDDDETASGNQDACKDAVVTLHYVAS